MINETIRHSREKAHLRQLSEDRRKLLDTASSIIDLNYREDPKYKLVLDVLK
ncbi:MAG: hypothetical protein OEV89_08515 [Desulfobulbaceae bacterium]|nr:hypothetical protein [Desulfobulbaceae bacterium]